MVNADNLNSQIPAYDQELSTKDLVLALCETYPAEALEKAKRVANVVKSIRDWGKLSEDIDFTTFNKLILEYFLNLDNGRSLTAKIGDLIYIFQASRKIDCPQFVTDLLMGTNDPKELRQEIGLAYELHLKEKQDLEDYSSRTSPSSAGLSSLLSDFSSEG